MTANATECPPPRTEVAGTGIGGPSGAEPSEASVSPGRRVKRFLAHRVLLAPEAELEGIASEVVVKEALEKVRYQSRR